ncbi:hypothetical protein GCM10027047_15400 [Rhodococcus aerolatus]
MPLLLRRSRRPRRGALAVATTALLLVTGAGLAVAANPGGPDVASYQHPGGASIDWTRVKAAGQSFALVKSTEGTGYVNPYFSSDWQSIRAAGMVRASYHYAKPGISPTAQADFFVQTAGPMNSPGDLPPVLDLESTDGLGPAALQDWTRTFLQRVQTLTGRTPIIYTYPSFWENQMGNSTAFTQYPLWIADYNGGDAPRTPLVGGWPTWTFWQYTDSGRIDGIPAAVDRNSFNGDEAALTSLAAGGAPSDVAQPSLPSPVVPGAPLPVTSPTGSAILTKWETLGGKGSVMGDVDGGEYDVEGGKAQDFDNGTIYWSPATGAHAVQGKISDAYDGADGPASWLGLPTTDELPAVDGGRVSFFERGFVYWSPSFGTSQLQSMATTLWGSATGALDRVSVPTDDPTVAPQGRELPLAGKVLRYNSTTGVVSFTDE